MTLFGSSFYHYKSLIELLLNIEIQSKFVLGPVLLLYLYALFLFDLHGARCLIHRSC